MARTHKSSIQISLDPAAFLTHKEILDLIKDEDMPRHLVPKLSAFKSAIAVAVGDFDAAVSFQQTSIECNAKGKTCHTHQIALSEALVRIGRLHHRKGDRSAAINAADLAAQIAFEILKQYSRGDIVQGVRMEIGLGVVMQIGDLFQDLGMSSSASRIYSGALQVMESTKDGNSLYQKALLLDSKAFQAYRKGRLSEAISGLTESLKIKIQLNKFESIREMQIALSHLKRWRSKEIISEKMSLAEKAAEKVVGPKPVSFKVPVSSFRRIAVDKEGIFDAEA